MSLTFYSTKKGGLHIASYSFTPKGLDLEMRPLSSFGFVRRKSFIPYKDITSVDVASGTTTFKFKGGIVDTLLFRFAGALSSNDSGEYRLLTDKNVQGDLRKILDQHKIAHNDVSRSGTHLVKVALITAILFGLAVMVFLASL